MKIKIIVFFIILFLLSPVTAEARKSSGFSYKPPKFSTPRNYQRGGQLKIQKGYLKKNGTYVQPHLKTSPDQYKWNNRKNRYRY